MQQAIEDLQSEEEKVNLLTKERAKLQVQAEDVSVFGGDTLNLTSVVSSFMVLVQYHCNIWSKNVTPLWCFSDDDERLCCPLHWSPEPLKLILLFSRSHSHSVGVPVRAGAASAWGAGERQEEAGGRQQVHSGEPHWDGEDEEQPGGTHEEVDYIHASYTSYKRNKPVIGTQLNRL